MTFSFKILIPSLNSKIEKDMKVIVFIFLIVITNVCKAQAPWRAKLFVHFLDSNNQIVTDTVWFGCDSLGDIGYQENLDVIDTLAKTNKAFGFDSVVQIQFNTNCINVKYDIQAFKKGLFKFDIYTFGTVTSISWDTSDFIYNDSLYKIRGVRLWSSNSYLAAIDIDQYILYNENRNDNKFSFDSISIFNYNPTIHACNFNLTVTHLAVQIVMGFGLVGFKESPKSDVINIFPIPVNDLLNLEFETPFTGNLILRNQIGQILKFITLNNNQLIKINLSEYDNGLYYLSYQNNNNQLFYTKKIIIQH